MTALLYPVRGMNYSSGLGPLAYARGTATVVASLVILLGGAANVRAECGDSGVALQILGSGGPFGTGRASAGYIVWVDGVSRVMVDAGGGTFAHFHESRANLADLDLLALSHFHPDHSAEVPAILWPRGGNLRVAGPSGSEGFPSLDGFLGGLFGPEGVFRVLTSRATFDPITVDVKATAPTEVLRKGSLVVTAQGVPHGNVPALGYRVEVGDASIVFSSDQNGSDPGFTEFSKEADVLVVHFAGSEEPRGGQGRGGQARGGQGRGGQGPGGQGRGGARGGGQGSSLHAKPSVWGQIAADAEVKNLVLSHISSGQDFEANVGHLKSRYSGPLTVAEDMMCLGVE